MISQSEQDRVDYEAREKRRRDQLNRDDMIREGARDEGREEGALIGSIQALQDVLGDPVQSMEDLASRGPEELARIFEECRSRARRRNSN